MQHSPEASPSIPSVKLTALTVPTITNAINTLYTIHGTSNDTLKNASFGFVVPVDEADGDNNLVEQFADGARTLYSQNANGGNMTYVVSEYGVHIIFNLGGVRNIIDPISIKNNGLWSFPMS